MVKIQHQHMQKQADITANSGEGMLQTIGGAAANMSVSNGTDSHTFTIGDKTVEVEHSAMIIYIIIALITAVGLGVGIWFFVKSRQDKEEDK